MRMILFALLFLTANLSHVVAQDEQTLKQYFEGKTIKVKIDMPATFEGINIYPNNPNPLEQKKYIEKLNQNGISIHKGEHVQITKILQKEKHIEFQLGGGGYSPIVEKIGDPDKSTLSESDEEKKLKEKIKLETNNTEKARLNKALRKLQRIRRTEQEELNMNAKKSQASQKEQTSRMPRESGSRFSIRYSSKVGHEQLTIESIKTALCEYVNFESLK